MRPTQAPVPDRAEFGRRWTRGASALLAAVTVLLTSCAGPGPTLFPAAPLERHTSADGGEERGYDLDHDGRVDYREYVGANGVVAALRYSADESAIDELEVRLADIPPSEIRDLIILLDSVPYEIVRSVWENGRLRFFHPPSRVISPFPVMTDVSFSEFFGITPCPGVEAEYFNGKVLTGGFRTYMGGGNAPWLAYVDYRLVPIAHAVAYLDSHAWYLHELGRIEESFRRTAAGPFVGYCVGTSALGAQHGRNGHHAALVRLDRFCQAIMRETRGRTRITLLSDHGHNLQISRRMPLPETLELLGYRISAKRPQNGDIVVPQFGIVTYASIHTADPASVAADVVGIEGVDFAAYCDEHDDVVVVSADGRARISRTDGRSPLRAADTRSGPTPLSDGRGGDGVSYRYVTERGDPLRLKPILAELRQRGQVSPDGFVRDAVLFAATEDHFYPDGVHRLWRAFHGLICHTPDVMVSIKDGYHSGSAAMSDIRSLAAAHGNLGRDSSYGFAMTMAGALPPVLRMEDLRATLLGMGVRFQPDP